MSTATPPFDFSPLHSARLTLKLHSHEDISDLHEIFSSSVAPRYMGWEPHNLLSQTEELIERWQNRYQLGKFDRLSVVSKELGKVIGAVGYEQYETNPDVARLVATFNLNYGKQGYAKEAGRLLLEHLFYSVNFYRLEGSCDLENVASGSVMEGLGMQREAVLRGNYFSPTLGQFRDSYLYAVLRPEFPRWTSSSI